MTVHTCPRCELRFERETEVVDHLANDHGLDPEHFHTRPDPTHHGHEPADPSVLRST